MIRNITARIFNGNTLDKSRTNQNSLRETKDDQFIRFSGHRRNDSPISKKSLLDWAEKTDWVKVRSHKGSSHISLYINDARPIQVSRSHTYVSFPALHEIRKALGLKSDEQVINTLSSR